MINKLNKILLLYFTEFINLWLDFVLAFLSVPENRIELQIMT